MLQINFLIVLEFVEFDHEWFGMSSFGFDHDFVCIFACLVAKKKMQKKKRQTSSLGKNFQKNNEKPKKKGYFN